MSVLIGEPISVGGRECVLVPDEIAPADNTGYTLITERGSAPAMYVRKDAVADIRREHPKLPVYGLWQTLLASGVVDTSNSLTVYRPDTDNGSSSVFYLYAEDGQFVKAGRSIGVRLPPTVKTRYEDAVEVSPAIGDLLLPKSEIRLPSEMIAARRRAERKNLYAGLAVAFGLVGLAYGYSSFQQQKTDRREVELRHVRDESMALSGQIARARRLRRTSDNTTVPGERLREIYELIRLSRLVEIDRTSLNRGQISALTYGLLAQPDWIDSVQPMPTGGYLIRFGGQ